MEHSVFIGLGANQGEKIKNCEQAIEAILKIEGICLIGQSSWYSSEPWGKECQEWFINGVIQIKTDLNPYALLTNVKHIEKRLGRKNHDHWGARSIDIDILFYDDLTVKKPELEIPHPRIPERNFVLIPFVEIAPHFVHPVLKKTIRELLQKTSDRKKIFRIEKILR